MTLHQLICHHFNTFLMLNHDTHKIYVENVKTITIISNRAYINSCLKGIFANKRVLLFSSQRLLCSIVFMSAPYVKALDAL